MRKAFYLQKGIGKMVKDRRSAKLFLIRPITNLLFVDNIEPLYSGLHMTRKTHITFAYHQLSEPLAPIMKFPTRDEDGCFFCYKIYLEIDFRNFVWWGYE